MEKKSSSYLRQAGPDGQGHQPLDLLADQVNLEAVEAVVQEDEDAGLLFEAQLARLLQCHLHQLIEEAVKVLGQLLEHLPGLDPLAKLLVDHHDDGEDVLGRRLVGSVVGPKIVLQVLAELEHHDAPHGELGAAHLVRVDLVDDAGIVRHVLAAGLRCPVLGSQLRH